jgi:GR25 family glycosyltransferase involved in LPS biosynthesis
MNNPLAGSQGNFRFVSSRNRSEDEKSLVDLRSQKRIASNNPCKFPSKVYVINRSERKDRWETFQRINSDLFSKFQVERWEATSTSYQITSTVDAIFQSFLNCLDHSLEKEECVIIMEDDSYLAEGGLEKLKIAWKDPIYREKILSKINWKGKNHTEDTKQLMSERAKNRIADKNSQYGTCWINNGTISKKIKKSDEIPEGWTLGRKYNKE